MMVKGPNYRRPWSLTPASSSPQTRPGEAGSVDVCPARWSGLASMGARGLGCSAGCPRPRTRGGSTGRWPGAAACLAGGTAMAVMMAAVTGIGVVKLSTQAGRGPQEAAPSGPSTTMRSLLGTPVRTADGLRPAQTTVLVRRDILDAPVVLLDPPRRSEPPPRGGRRRRALPLLGVLGPGFVAGLSDDDPAGITTYSLLGADHGYRLLWVLRRSTLALMVSSTISGRAWEWSWPAASTVSSTCCWPWRPSSWPTSEPMSGPP